MLVELNGMEFHVAMSAPGPDMTVQIADEQFLRPMTFTRIASANGVVTALRAYSGMPVSKSAHAKLRRHMIALRSASTN